MGQRPRQRSNLNSRGNGKTAKSLSRGFGVVRKLTNASQQEVFRSLASAEIGQETLRSRQPLHLTLVQFIKMSPREQMAFHAGMNVVRLEETLERGVEDLAPRKALAVELGGAASVGSFVYVEVEDPRIKHEQVQLVGTISLHSKITMNRLNRQVIPPHIGIGHAHQGPIEEVMQRVEQAITGQAVALQRWDVYPERYA